MMLWHVVIATAICFVNITQLGNSYRILGVFSTPSISHQVVFRGLTLALNKRGHELVVATTDPINDPTLKNYTEIDISNLYVAFESFNYIEIRKKKLCLYELFEMQVGRFYQMSESLLSNSELRKLYAPRSNEEFDLLLVEMLYMPVVLPLATRFNVPVIGITSMSLTLHNNYVIGNPIIPSDYTNWELDNTIFEPMSFWHRLKNFIIVWQYLYWYQTTYLAEQTSIARKYFGNDTPDLSDLEKNVSLIFVNQRTEISYARPTVPKVFNIGGFHVSKQVSHLSKDLQKLLDEATEGFVYMSLGSNVNSTMFSNETIIEFNTAFSRLPYKVLWKFEDDVLPGKPDNVHIMKWVPQQAVLAHPNLKVFIYQGGLQSTEEAVTHAVPLVGFPVFADQEMQVTKMASLGVAIKLEITAVDGNELYEAITTVAMDSSFKERMLNLQSLIKDKPHDPLENAVWWTEFVIRHRGAPHLYSSTADGSWYSQQDVDIIAFILAGFTIILLSTLVILYRIIKYIYACNERSQDRSKKIN